MEQFEDYYMSPLVREARQSSCRIQKAAIIVKEQIDNHGMKGWMILGWGANQKKTIEAICNSCNKDENDLLSGCVRHAEKVAIADALAKGHSLVGAFILSVVLKDGFVDYPTKPSCDECAKMIDDFGAQFLSYQKKMQLPQLVNS